MPAITTDEVDALAGPFAALLGRLGITVGRRAARSALIYAVTEPAPRARSGPGFAPTGTAWSASDAAARILAAAMADAADQAGAASFAQFAEPILHPESAGADLLQNRLRKLGAAVEKRIQRRDARAALAAGVDVAQEAMRQFGAIVEEFAQKAQRESKSGEISGEPREASSYINSGEIAPPETEPPIDDDDLIDAFVHSYVTRHHLERRNTDHLRVLIRGALTAWHAGSVPAPTFAAAAQDVTLPVLPPRLMLPPVPSLSADQLDAIRQRAREHPFPEGKKKDDRRTPFEWVRDHYSDWIPGLLVAHLSVDPALYRNFRFQLSELGLPPWLDVPTKWEAKVRNLPTLEEKLVEVERRRLNAEDRQRSRAADAQSGKPAP